MRPCADALAEQEETPDDLAQRLTALFGVAQPGALVDWQKLACALATRGAFSIVTGGPGTGKTTTVVRLLALLQARRWRQENPCASAWRHPPARPPRG